jgi:hypothetical protein
VKGARVERIIITIRVNGNVLREARFAMRAIYMIPTGPRNLVVRIPADLATHSSKPWQNIQLDLTG